VQLLNILELEPYELEVAVQNQYNDAYRTNLFVTSTISICVKKRFESLINEKIVVKTRKIQDA
jgi:hypothetical protein